MTRYAGCSHAYLLACQIADPHERRDVGDMHPLFVKRYISSRTIELLT